MSPIAEVSALKVPVSILIIFCRVPWVSNTQSAFTEFKNTKSHWSAIINISIYELAVPAVVNLVTIDYFPLKGVPNISELMQEYMLADPSLVIEEPRRLANAGASVVAKNLLNQSEF